VVLAAIGVNLLITLVVFLMAGTIVRLIGASVAGALTRILGVILAALSAQLIIDGVRGAFGIG
jgi:multiple antibiotic resistance protein